MQNRPLGRTSRSDLTKMLFTYVQKPFLCFVRLTEFLTPWIARNTDLHWWCRHFNESLQEHWHLHGTKSRISKSTLDSKEQPLTLISCKSSLRSCKNMLVSTSLRRIPICTSCTRPKFVRGKNWHAHTDTLLWLVVVMLLRMMLIVSWCNDKKISALLSRVSPEQAKLRQRRFVFGNSPFSCFCCFIMSE